jgi:3-methyladenine DNA glycosylase AlkC
MAESNPLLKDILFNEQVLDKISSEIHGSYSEFDKFGFKEAALKEFPNMELKERMNHVSILLEQYIKKDYHETLKILENSLLNRDKSDESFIYGAYQDFIMNNGCTDEHVDLSLDYLRKFTSSFSGEFAIRSFINEYPNKTFEAAQKWITSDSYHERRLATEGFRPKLPWAKGITMDYKKAALLLDELYFDNERIVTRSVANHLNDISKFDPDFVVSTLKRWKEENRQDDKELTYLINHSLRTSVKKGHKDTLEFLGYPTNPNIKIENQIIQNKELQLGDYLVFEFDVTALEDLSLMVDYTIDYPMANNKRSEKVFKIKKLSLKTGDTVHISKKHQFKLMTTKKLYTGDYKLTLKINGKSVEFDHFYLKTDY